MIHIRIVGIFIASLTAFYVAVADEPKGEDSLTIKEIMRQAMTKGLAKKVIQKEASQDEQERLASLLEAMAKLEPPKGSKTEWERLNSELSRRAREVATGQPSHTALNLAINCNACHRSHRPK